MRNMSNSGFRFFFTFAFSILICLWAQTALSVSTSETKVLSWNWPSDGWVSNAKATFTVRNDGQVIFNGTFGTCSWEDGKEYDNPDKLRTVTIKDADDTSTATWSYSVDYGNTKGDSDPIYLHAGTYYVYTTTLAKEGSLSLLITCNHALYPSENEPNHTQALAKEFSLSVETTGNIGFQPNNDENANYWALDVSDYFKFTSNKSGTLTLDCRIVNADPKASRTGFSFWRDDVLVNTVSILHADSTQETTAGPYTIKANTTYYVSVSHGASAYWIKPTFEADGDSNTSPSAVDDSASTNKGIAVTIDVMANDTDADGDSLSIVSVTSPGSGMATSSSGKIIYTPESTFTGTDSFQYTVNDGNGGTDSATVTVTVTASTGTMPTVVTNSPTWVTKTCATLNGTVNPNGGTTTYYFEYGTDTNYGNTTSSSSAGSGTSATSVNAEICGLTSDTTYNYRLAATNSEGTSYGDNKTFSTVIVYVGNSALLCGGNTPCHTTIQDAIDAVTAQGIVKMVSGEDYNFENLIVDRLETLFILSGGWDSTYTTQSSTTTVNSITMGADSGTTEIDNLTIR